MFEIDELSTNKSLRLAGNFCWFPAMPVTPPTTTPDPLSLICDDTFSRLMTYIHKT